MVKSKAKTPKSEKKVAEAEAEKVAKEDNKVIDEESTKLEKPLRIGEEKPKKPVYDFKLFDRWELTGIHVSDAGLKRYINLTPQMVPFSAGRTVKKQFWKSKKNIVERLIGRVFVAGHKGKKHWRTSGINTGKFTVATKIIKQTFEILEKKTQKNPIQVLVDAICIGSPREGVTTIEYGGVRYPKAVDISPQKRIDLALRWMVQGAFQKASTSGKTKMSEALADQIILSTQQDAKANCIQKRFELERQSAASR